MFKIKPNITGSNMILNIFLNAKYSILCLFVLFIYICDILYLFCIFWFVYLCVLVFIDSDLASRAVYPSPTSLRTYIGSVQVPPNANRCDALIQQLEPFTSTV